MKARSILVAALLPICSSAFVEDIITSIIELFIPDWQVSGLVVCYLTNNNHTWIAIDNKQTHHTP